MDKYTSNIFKPMSSEPQLSELRFLYIFDFSFLASKRYLQLQPSHPCSKEQERKEIKADSAFLEVPQRLSPTSHWPFSPARDTRKCGFILPIWAFCCPYNTHTVSWEKGEKWYWIGSQLCRPHFCIFSYIPFLIPRNLGLSIQWSNLLKKSFWIPGFFVLYLLCLLFFYAYYEIAIDFSYFFLLAEAQKFLKRQK